MKLLILGAGGMLGHKLLQLLQEKHSVLGTLRGEAADFQNYGLLTRGSVLGSVDALDLGAVRNVLASFRPDFVVNCVGIIKQRAEARDPLVAIGTNALLPHQLAGLCADAGAALIQISTDCVFSGRRGGYAETDASDAEDLYGRTKFLGEVSGPHALTLRTSVIGRELRTRHGLVEWFLQADQREVPGYRRVVYSGLTTRELANVIELVMERRPGMRGIYQVSSDPIDKLALLQLLGSAFGVSTEVVPTEQPVLDRSLDSSRFRQEIGYRPPDWPAMIAEMAADPTPYGQWR